MTHDGLAWTNIARLGLVQTRARRGRGHDDLDDQPGDGGRTGAAGAGSGLAHRDVPRRADPAPGLGLWLRRRRQGARPGSSPAWRGSRSAALIAALRHGARRASWLAGLALCGRRLLRSSASGAGAAGTSVLAMLATGVAPQRRAAAATLVWMMMIFGFALTAPLAGHFLDPIRRSASSRSRRRRRSPPSRCRSSRCAASSPRAGRRRRRPRRNGVPATLSRRSGPTRRPAGSPLHLCLHARLYDAGVADRAVRRPRLRHARRA